MPQTKKKSTKKTAKRPAARTTHKKVASRTNCKKGSANISSRDRAHVCFVAALAIITGILICADAAIMSIA